MSETRNQTTTDAPDRLRRARLPGFPPPEFPPRRPALFARLPPAVFSPLLGLLGLVLALRAGGRALDLGLLSGLADLAAGLVLGLWLFAVLGLKVKILRRPGVLIEDLRPLPGRAGLAAATMGGMAAALVLEPFAPRLALALALASLVAHVLVTLALGLALRRTPGELRAVNPTWQMSLVGPILAAIALGRLGYPGPAGGIFWLSLGLAVLIWGLSVAQFAARIPPAPLRPLLAIHISPAALLSIEARAMGLPLLADGLLILAAALALALVLGARWLLEAGFTPIWAALTFPLAALASALIGAGGWAGQIGLILCPLLCLAIPAIAWRVLRLWPGGRLAAVTNAAEA